MPSSKGNTAWMLRQRGDAFSVMHHFYVMYDPDLSSEAEVSAFLISTKSKDQDLAKNILDCWMCYLLRNEIEEDYSEEEIIDSLEYVLKNLPYRFQYPLTISQLLNIHTSQNNFTDGASLLQFANDVDSNLEELQSRIADSLNQQFCRVRFGGQYNSKGTRDLWFRISSSGYNWANEIYTFTANHYQSLDARYINICRDYESDYGDVEGKPEFFYKAKDGVPYKNMPILDYLTDEHDSRPIFSSTRISILMSKGHTFEDIYNKYGYYSKYGYDKELRNSMVRKEKSKQCIDASYIEDNDLSSRFAQRLRNICRMILSKYSELTQVEIDDIKPHENTRGKMVASEVIFLLSSDYEDLNNLEVSIVLNRGIKDTTPAEVVRKFSIEYEDYKKFEKIDV